MKVIIRDGKLFDPKTGYEVQLNKRFLYETELESFKYLADNTEVEINNCWRSEDIRSEECTILYGSSIAFSIKSAYSKDDVPDAKEYEQTLINKGDNLKGDEVNGNSGNCDNDNEHGVSDSLLCDNVQNESESSDQISGDNPE